MTKKGTLLVLLAGLILSSLIAFISFGFIFLESHLSHLIWQKIPELLPFKPTLYFLIVSLCGGIILGKLHLLWGNYPKTAHHTMSELKEQERVDYQPVFKNLLLALVILMFGAGVGPEAALLSSVIMLSIWQADKLRFLYFHFDTVSTQSFKEKIVTLFHPNDYVIAYKTYPPKSSKFRKLLIVLYIINGLVAFFFLMKVTDQPSFITKLGHSNWNFSELLWLFPFILLGGLMGIFYNFGKKKMQFLANYIPNKPYLKELMGASCIFFIASCFPNLLFSGQTSLGMVPNSYQAYSTLALIGIVWLKLLFLQICLNTGWVGGDIFPIVFSSIIYGYSLALLMPTVDSLFIVAVVATAMSITILQSPLGIAFFVSLFFPLSLVPIIFLTAILLKLLIDWTQKRKVTV